MKSIITADSRYTKEFTMASSSKKSTTIVNQYQYTDPLMVEVQDGYAAQTYKNYITLIIIALICAFFTWREYNTHKGVLCILFAIIVVLCVIATIVSLVSTNKRKKAEIQAFRDSYSKDGYDLMITIEGTRIRSYKNNAPEMCIRDICTGNHSILLNLQINKRIPVGTRPNNCYQNYYYILNLYPTPQILSLIHI